MARGVGRVYKRGPWWWVQWSDHGTRKRESSYSTLRSDAVALLKQRLSEADKARPSDARKVTLQDLRRLVLQDYRIKDRRSAGRVSSCWVHLAEHLGPEEPVLNITLARLNGYHEDRLEEGAKAATIKLEVAFLKRAFNLARKAGMLRPDEVPTDYPTITPNNRRKGFFEADQLAAVMEHLPADVADLVSFLSWTGWRVSEARGLRWSDVDLDAQVVRIEETKSDEPRTLPFGKLPALVALLAKRHEARAGAHVFHRRGDAIRSFASAWVTATKAAGCSGLLVHDLRRTAARNLSRAGVPERVIMDICGWKTRSVFDRYRIVPEADLGRRPGEAGLTS